MQVRQYKHATIAIRWFRVTKAMVIISCLFMVSSPPVPWICIVLFITNTATYVVCDKQMKLLKDKRVDLIIGAL